jgi:CD151 antigen
MIELTFGGVAFVYKTKLKDTLRSDMEEIVINEYGQQGYEIKTKSLDDLQIKFKCCGASNFLDYRKSKYVRNNTIVGFNLVAESCCKTPAKLCAKRDHPSNINYNVSF